LPRHLKGRLVIGLAALAVVAFAGGAYAATQSSGPTTRQAFLNDVAKRLHVTPQQLTAALNGAATDQLQAEVKAGRLTQAQANALEQRLKKNGAAPAVPFGFFGPPGAPGKPGLPGAPGPLAPGAVGPHFRGLAVPFAVAGGLKSIASYLGLTNAQLFQQLNSGKSLAQIATANGKSVSGLEQTITTADKADLDKLVANKMLTAAQENQILSRLSARVASEVNRKGFGFPRFRGPALRFHGGAPALPKGAPSPGGLGPAAPLFAPSAPSA
jgi:hypothetical protein